MCRRAFGIERRDAHQPVHAALGLQPAIGVGAVDLHRRRFDAGALAGALLEPLDLVAVRLGPAHIHAQQHLGPVLRLGAAGAGVDFEIAVVGVGLARQQALDLAALRLLAQRRRAAPRPRRRSPGRPRPRRARSARRRPRPRARCGDSCRSPSRAGCARARPSAPRPGRPRAWGLRPWRSARRDGGWRRPSQRCLLSSANDFSMSSTTACVSARMDLFPCPSEHDPGEGRSHLQAGGGNMGPGLRRDTLI